MEINFNTMLARYLSEKREPWTRDDRIAYTIGALLSTDGDLMDLRIHKSAEQFDSQVIDSILQAASPIEVAVLLHDVGISLPAPVFESHARRVLNSTRDFLALSYLGATIYSRERVHGHHLDVPAEVISTLREAPDQFARVAGLKLLALTKVTLDDFAMAIVAMLRQANALEVNAALNLAHDVLFYDFPQRMDLKACAVWPDLREELMKVRDTAQEEHLRDVAGRILR